MAKGKHEKEKENRSVGWSVANIAVTVTLFIGITVALLVLERPTVSYTEKRPLAEFPEFSFEKLFSGEYTDEITEWFDDTVPWRDGFKDISANIIKNMGVSFGNVGSVTGTLTKVEDQENQDTGSRTEAPPAVSDNISESSGVGENTASATEPAADSSAETSAETAPAHTTPAYDPRNEIAEGIVTNGTVVCEIDGHWWGISFYSGGYNRDYFVQYINDFARDLGDGIQTYVMTTPTHSEFYTPANFAEYNASQSNVIDYVAERLDDNIISINCCYALEQHLTEPIFLRTDWHWQPLGAYYAAEQFAQAAGVPFADISTYERMDIEGFVGSQYSVTTLDARLLNDPETLTYYKPSNKHSCDYYDTSYNLEYEAWPIFIPGSKDYSGIFGGDRKIVRIETDVNNGRKLAVLKDSYGNAEVPFYVGSFEEIYVIDVRWFDLNAIDFIKEHGVTDVLFSMSTVSATGSNADHIDRIRTQ